MVKIIIFNFLIGSTAWAVAPQAVRDNNAGVEYLKNDNNQMAYQFFVIALQNAPFDGTLHFNLGVTFEKNEEPEKAMKEYAAALRLSQDKQVQFAAHFNLARLLAQQKNIDGALMHYQAALAIDPSSKEVKTNIELLWQGGGGGGQGEDQNQNQSGKGGQNKQDQNKNDQDQNEKKDPQNGKFDDNQNQKRKQPKPFESRELTKDDVRKILEELSNQEQKIRALEFGKGVKERPRDKDW